MKAGAKRLTDGAHVICINQFFKTPIKLPVEFDTHANIRKHLYLFTSDEHIRLFLFDQQLNMKQIIPAEYAMITQSVIDFLKKIESWTNHKCCNIHIFINKTIDDKTSVTPWHDDFINDSQRVTRQISVILSENSHHTQFANRPMPPTSNSQQFDVIDGDHKQCDSTVVGSGTYWRNGYVHRKPPKSHDSESRVNLLVVFDFVTDAALKYALSYIGRTIFFSPSELQAIGNILTQTPFIKVDLTTIRDIENKEYIAIAFWDHSQSGGRSILNTKLQKISIHTLRTVLSSVKSLKNRVNSMKKNELISALSKIQIKQK